MVFYLRLVSLTWLSLLLGILLGMLLFLFVFAFVVCSSRIIFGVY